MKVILAEEVVGLGEPGKVVDVAPGYARNFLVPRKLAVYADTGKGKELEHNKRRLERKRQRLQQVAMSTAQRMDGKVLTIETRVGQGGKLYGSVTTSDIADALKAQLGETVDRRKIHLPRPIHTTGSYQADIHLIGDTRATVTVNVEDAAHPELEAPAATPVAETPLVEAPVAEAPAAEAAPEDETA